jgi:hypothetical protein
VKFARFGACVTLLFLALVRSADAQSSMVPATHVVYDWLHTQRVFGRLPDYQDEVLPLSRSVILQQLRILERDSLKLSWTDRELLHDFLNEFDMTRLRHNGAFNEQLIEDFPNGIVDAIAKRRDPYIYAGQDKDSVFSGALWIARGQGLGSLRSAGVGHYAELSEYDARAFVNTGNGFGFHLEFETTNYGGDSSVFSIDPKLGSSPDYRNGTGAPNYYEAWVSFARKYVNVTFGSGAAQYGPAITDPLILRADGPNITQFRVQIGTPKLNATFTQGALTSYATTDSLYLNGQLIQSRVVPQRWVAMSRFTWSPTPRFIMDLNQMMIYSGRQLDPTLLIPVIPIQFEDRVGGATDNALVGFDLIGRPLDGTEMFASVLIDDSKSWTSFIHPGTLEAKEALNFGLEQRLPFDIRLGIGYLRTDPFMYTHWERLNAWEEGGLPLGPSIGPNSDEIAFRLTRWFPLRTRLMLGIRKVRNGLNPVDSLGNTTVNVGGDLLNGLQTFGVFMQGADIQTYYVNEGTLETEIVRGIRLSLQMSQTRIVSGTRVAPSRSLLFWARFGF